MAIRPEHRIVAEAAGTPRRDDQQALDSAERSSSWPSGQARHSTATNQARRSAASIRPASPARRAHPCHRARKILAGARPIAPNAPPACHPAPAPEAEIRRPAPAGPRPCRRKRLDAGIAAKLARPPPVPASPGAALDTTSTRSGRSSASTSRSLPGLWLASTRLAPRGAGGLRPRPAPGALRREQRRTPLRGRSSMPRNCASLKRCVLGRGLHLDDAAAVGQHEVGVGVGRAVLGIVEVQHRRRRRCRRRPRRPGRSAAAPHHVHPRHGGKPGAARPRRR